MNWHDVIKTLNDSGLTEAAIVDALKDMGIETTQASINRLKRGHVKQPRYDVGNALIYLQKKLPEKDHAA